MLPRDGSAAAAAPIEAEPASRAGMLRATPATALRARNSRRDSLRAFERFLRVIGPPQSRIECPAPRWTPAVALAISDSWIDSLSRSGWMSGPWGAHFAAREAGYGPSPRSAKPRHVRSWRKLTLYPSPSVSTIAQCPSRGGSAGGLRRADLAAAHNVVRNTNALGRDHTTDTSGRAHSRSRHRRYQNLGWAALVTRGAKPGGDDTAKGRLAALEFRRKQADERARR